MKNYRNALAGTFFKFISVIYFQVVNQKLKQFWLGYWEIWTSHF